MSSPQSRSTNTPAGRARTSTAGNLALADVGPEVVAGIYARISLDRADDQGVRQGLGVKRQVTDCRSLARKQGWAVHDEYVDNSVSAFSGKTRPEYERMLADIRAGRINLVIVWHPDRLTRRPIELEALITLVEAHGVRIVTVTAGDIDFSTAEGRLMARITGAVARKESEDKSRRLKRKFVEQAAAGRVSGGGRRPFGFEADRITLKPDEAALIRDAVTRVLTGTGLRAIANEWDRDGVPTVTGGAWSRKTLKTLLCSARIAGWREHRGEWVAEAIWPAIVSREDVERVRAILTDKSRSKATRQRIYLLTGGAAQCGRCHRPLISRQDYVCSKQPEHGGCGGLRVNRLGLEATVREMVAAVINDKAFTRRLAATKTDQGDERALVTAVTADEAQLADLADLWADGKMSKISYVKAHDRITGRLEANRAKLTALTAPSPASVVAAFGGVAKLRKAWATIGEDGGMSIADQRTIIMALIEYVEVMPVERRGTRFDPERVRPKWRV